MKVEGGGENIFNKMELDRHKRVGPDYILSMSKDNFSISIFGIKGNPRFLILIKKHICIVS